MSKHKLAPVLALKWFSLTKQGCLTSLQPIRIRAANAFAALAFLVWPATRRILQKAVCHLAAHINNNIQI